MHAGGVLTDRSRPLQTVLVTPFTCCAMAETASLASRNAENSAALIPFRISIRNCSPSALKASTFSFTSCQHCNPLQHPDDDPMLPCLDNDNFTLQ